MARPESLAAKQFTYRHPYLLTVEDVAQQLGVSDLSKGLTNTRVQELQASHPPNELEDGKAVSWYKILMKQIANAMILVLIFAMALSFGIKDYIEGGVLVGVIVLNVVIGFYQEFQAEKKMDALRALSSPSARVRRDGKDHVTSSAEVVPGDVVELKTGDTVPADLRMFKVMNLNCDEKSLTGEAEPVEKDIQAKEEELGVGDRTNMAYATTTVTKGHGWGIVTFTGMDTEVGKIAASTTKKERKPGRSMSFKKYGKIQPVRGAFWRVVDAFGKFLGLTEGTPLQRKLSMLAYILFGGAIVLAMIVFGVNNFHVTNEVAIYAISTGIAIIPESLVAVLTITMVVGMKVMQKANVVIRDLSALEALGGITNICSDKTGTLTEGTMIVKKAWLPNVGIFTVDSVDPNNPTEGAVKQGTDALPHNLVAGEQNGAQNLKFIGVPASKEAKDQEKYDERVGDDEVAGMTPDLQAFLKPAALCNLATVTRDGDKEAGAHEWKTTGEPTEIALQVFAHRFDYGKDILESQGWTQVHGGEFPFDSSIKRMSVVYNYHDNPDSMVFTKGAVEPILELCTSIGSGKNNHSMTQEMKEDIIPRYMEHFATQGFRVLALASKTWNGDFSRSRAHLDDQDLKKDLKDQAEKALRSEVENNLTFLGLVGIYDPPRVETKDSIRECRQAGIDVHMLTGDHPATATAIALDIGILKNNWSESMVKKAKDFDNMTDAEIDAMPELPLVIARCAPDTKTKMIKALRRRKLFMAMTGDGVNDAPSLSAADVGIAMGTGSDVAKGAAEIVLTDDKFNSIVAAIREGRRMFDNIQKFILHLLTSNVAEVILLIAGLGFKDVTNQSVFPLSPLQILWINMITSSFPAFGLGREKATSEIMKRPPHDIKKGVFTLQIMVDMFVYGILMGACTLLTFVIIIYGKYKGNLGTDCNRAYSPSCEAVFRARGAVFVELTWLILVSAWEFKSIRRSMFHLDPASEISCFRFLKDLYENRFLFFSVVLGALSVFLCVYIPVFNEKVFKQKGFGWEWALVFSAVIVFVTGVETWKFVKRRCHLFEHDMKERGGDEEGGFVKRLRRSGTSFSSRSADSTCSAKEKLVDMAVLSTAPTTRTLVQAQGETG